MKVLDYQYKLGEVRVFYSVNGTEDKHFDCSLRFILPSGYMAEFSRAGGGEQEAGGLQLKHEHTSIQHRGQEWWNLHIASIFSTAEYAMQEYSRRAKLIL
jgi:hypothetical protein